MIFLLFISLVLFCCYYVYNMYKSLFSKMEYTQSKLPFKNSVEHQTPIQLNVEKGAIPSWLNGIMYRIGPGRFRIHKNDDTEYMFRHAFDGLPFVHRFELNGKTQTLKYNSRLTAKTIEKRIQDGTLRGELHFGHVDTYSSIFQWLPQVIARFSALLVKTPKQKLPDEHTVGVTTTPNFPLPKTKKVSDGHVLVSKTDANILQKIHAETLEPEMAFNYTAFDERIVGQLSAAHHQWDPETNETFNFTLTIAPSPRLVVFGTSGSGDVKILGDVTRRFDGSPIQAPYIHSLWLTKNYVIIPEAPMYSKKPLNLLLAGSILATLCWEKNEPTYFHVFHRDGRGLVASIPFRPGFFTFHTANAFESDGLLYLDSASFDNGDVLHQVQSFGQPRMHEFDTTATRNIDINGIMHPVKPQFSYGSLVRYCLDVKKQTATKEELAPNLEFPRFNHSFALRDYQYVFGCRLYRSEKQVETGSLIKVDIGSKKTKEFLVEGCSCSEPIFVPKPDGQSEDDGVLLTLVNSEENCYLMVVDALEMKELTRILIGQFTAVTFHGSYVDHEFKTISPN